MITPLSFFILFHVGWIGTCFIILAFMACMLKEAVEGNKAARWLVGWFGVTALIIGGGIWHLTRPEPPKKPTPGWIMLERREVRMKKEHTRWERIYRKTLRDQGKTVSPEQLEALVQSSINDAYRSLGTYDY